MLSRGHNAAFSCTIHIPGKIERSFGIGTHYFPIPVKQGTYMISIGNYSHVDTVYPSVYTPHDKGEQQLLQGLDKGQHITIGPFPIEHMGMVRVRFVTGHVSTIYLV